MRSHTAVLRQITELNLDPKVANISDGNGGMIPKHADKCKVENIDYILGERLELIQEQEVTIDTVTADEQKEKLIDCIDEKDVLPAEENIIKKKFAFQKKKVPTPTE